MIWMKAERGLNWGNPCSLRVHAISGYSARPPLRVSTPMGCSYETSFADNQLAAMPRKASERLIGHIPSYRNPVQIHEEDSRLEHGPGRTDSDRNPFRIPDVELFGPEIADDTEGQESTYSDDPLVDWSRPETVSPFVESFVKVAEGRNPKLVNVTLNRKERSSDYSILSLSDRHDFELMQSLGYDAVVEMPDPIRFFDSLSACLVRSGKCDQGALISRCIYRERRLQHTKEDGAHPALAKHPRHQHQGEVRAIWSATGQPTLTAFVIACAAIYHSCRLIELQ